MTSTFLLVGFCKRKTADGKALCCWATQPGDIEGKPELEDAWQLGRSIQ